MWYYATEGSNGKDDIDTKGSILEDGFDTEGGGQDGSEGSIIHCTFALIKMTSELHMYVMKQQAGVSCRKSTNRKLSLQSSYSCLRYSEESSETNTTETRLADVHVQICNANKTCEDMILLSMVLW